MKGGNLEALLLSGIGSIKKRKRNFSKHGYDLMAHSQVFSSASFQTRACLAAPTSHLGSLRSRTQLPSGSLLQQAQKDSGRLWPGSLEPRGLGKAGEGWPKGEGQSGEDVPPGEVKEAIRAPWLVQGHLQLESDIA